MLRTRHVVRSFLIATIGLGGCGGISDSGIVSSTQPVVVRIVPDQLTLGVGESGRLTVEITGGRPTPTLVNCSSANTSVVTTTRDGSACTLQAVAPGSASVTATASDSKTSAAQITVSAPPPVVITISPAALPLNVGETGTLSVQISGGLTTPSLATCTSAATIIATASAQGSSCRVTAVFAGNTTITARATTGQEASSSVTVTALPPALGTLTVAPPTVTLPIGQTVALVAAANPASGAVQTQLTYASSSSAIASVSAGGVVTALTPGTAVITVTATGQGVGFTTVTRTATSTITVQTLPPALTAFTLTPAALSLTEGQSGQLVPVVERGASNVVATVTYQSGTPSVVTVSPTGAIAAVASGVAVITATATGSGAGFSSNSRTATSTISVTPGPAPILVDRASVAIDSVAPGATSEPIMVGVATTPGRSLGGLQANVTYASVAAPWLTASLSGGTTPATLTLTAAAGALPVGDYVADVQLSSSNAAHVPATVRVTMRVRAAGRVVVAPKSVTVGPLDPAEPPVNTAITVTSSNGATLSGLSARVEHIGTTAGWLTPTFLSTTAAPTATLSLRTSSSGLGNGTFQARVIVSTSAAGIAPDTTIVSLTVRRESIVISPSTVAFTLRTGTVSNAAVLPVATLSGDTLTLDTPVSGTRFYNGATTGWITGAGLSRSQLPLNLTIIVSAVGLAPGTYTGRIELYARNQSIKGTLGITLTVIP